MIEEVIRSVIKVYFKGFWQDQVEKLTYFCSQFRSLTPKFIKALFDVVADETVSEKSVSFSTWSFCQKTSTIFHRYVSQKVKT